MASESWPEFSFPVEEADRLRHAYGAARVILEYGSGGSSVLASALQDKLVFSVESDRDWAIRLQREIDTRDLPSPALVYHVDIGPTGDWGRPLGPEAWMRFHHYPLAIWYEPFFRQPDVVLIDGRFRPACLMATLLRTRKPVTVLFDDYTTRPAYHSVEAFLKPAEIVGRMAVFEIAPRTFDPSEIGMVMDNFFRATYHGRGPVHYDAAPNAAVTSAGPAAQKDRAHD